MQYLRVVQQASELASGRCQILWINTNDLVNGLGRRQMVTNRTNTAEALYHYGGFPVGVALNEALKTAELHNVEKGIFYLAGIIQMYRDFAVTFYPCYGINYNLLAHTSRI